MWERYLIDTNILIEYSSNILPDKAENFISKIVDENFNISIINKIEILGYNNAGRQIEEFISLAVIFSLTDEIADKTIELRRFKKLKLPDAVIAATAIINDFVLLTRNTKDFNNIDELSLLNPHEV